MRNGLVVQGKPGSKRKTTITKAQIDDLRGRMFLQEAANELGVSRQALARRFAAFCPGERWKQ
jgi:hypothetical protein